LGAGKINSPAKKENKPPAASQESGKAAAIYARLRAYGAASSTQASQLKKTSKKTENPMRCVKKPSSQILK